MNSESIKHNCVRRDTNVTLNFMRKDFTMIGKRLFYITMWGSTGFLSVIK